MKVQGKDTKNLEKTSSSKTAVKTKEKPDRNWAMLGAIIIVVLLVLTMVVVISISSHVSSSAKTSKSQEIETVAGDLGSSSNSKKELNSGTEKELPELKEGEARSDADLESLAELAEKQGDTQRAAYLRSLKGQGIKRDKVATKDSAESVAASVMEDIKSLSCSDFQAKYKNSGIADCDSYASFNSLLQKNGYSLDYRYSDNDKTWFTYVVPDNGGGVVVYIQKDNSVGEVQFAVYNPPLTGEK